MTMDVLRGDVIEVLREHGDETFTACLCDPPYGLQFMSKSWDHGVPGVPYWAEVLRVLKPGAVLLAFGGTRTSHRLASAIEDAGFEIYDSLMWLYGSGFCKGFNYRRMDLCSCVPAENALQYSQPDREAMSNEGNVCSMRQGVPEGAISSGASQGADVLQGMQREEAGRAPGQVQREHEGATSGAAVRREQPLLEGRPIHRAGQGLCDGEDVRSPESSTERLCVGAHLSSGADAGAPPNGNGRGASSEPRQGGQPARKSTDIRESRGSLDEGALQRRGICPRCGNPTKEWENYSTGLKPAYEPIVLARKPRRATYAQTAVEHGSGALNIEGCRVGTGEELGRKNNKGPYTDGRTWNTSITGPQDSRGQVSGRWPPNLLLSHSPGCERVGEKRVKSHNPDNKKPVIRGGESGIYGKYAPHPANKQIGYASPDGTEAVADWRCVEGCAVKALGEQSGVGGNARFGAAGTSHRTADKFPPSKGWNSNSLDPNAKSSPDSYGDTGTAARFFPQFEGERFLYSAKAGRSAREAGLIGHIPCPKCGGLDTVKGMHDGRETKCIRNTNPCVKPLAICRWLATLIRPPEEYLDAAALIVPFSGSGSEMIGAMQAGWRNIVGIELDDAYADIAEARIAHWREEMAADVLPLFAMAEAAS